MRILALFYVMIVLFSCSKDNEEAKKLDGTWKLDNFSFAGKDSIPAGQFSDSLGNWDFSACKSKTETCKGSAEGFLGGSTEGFGWYIRSKGTKFTFGADNVQSGIAQFGGDWDVSTLSESSFVITSESCGSCKALGKETLSFSK